MEWLIKRDETQNKAFWYHGLLATDNSRHNYKIFLVTSGILDGDIIYLNDKGELVKEGFKKEFEGLGDFLGEYNITSDDDIALLCYYDEINTVEDFKEATKDNKAKYVLYLNFTNSFELIVCKKHPNEKDCELRFDETTVDGFEDFDDLSDLDREIACVVDYMSEEKTKEDKENLLRPVEDFDNMTPEDAIDVLKSYDFYEVYGDDAEDLSDAVKRLVMLVEELQK